MTEQRPLPENVGALMHPVNRNYIMFSTFDGSNVEKAEYIMDLPEYQECIKKLVTVMEYENFQAIAEAASDDFVDRKPIHLPQTIRRMDDIPEDFADIITENCETYGEDTYAILRFFEFQTDDDGEAAYFPVHVNLTKEGFQNQKAAMAQVQEEE